MAVSSVLDRLDPFQLASQQAPARAQAAAPDAAVQAAQSQGQGGIDFNLTTPAGVEDARSRVAGAQAAATAKAQDTAPQPTAGQDAARLSATNSVVADAVQRATSAFQSYSGNGQPQDYGSSLPRGNVVDAIA